MEGAFLLLMFASGLLVIVGSLLWGRMILRSGRTHPQA
jgi:hypothetical protein